MQNDGVLKLVKKLLLGDKKSSGSQSDSDGNLELSAGKINFFNLADIRNRLGPKWPQYSKKISIVVEKTIKQNISDQDVLNKVDEENYMIVFSGLSLKNARFKCAIIADEIERNLNYKNELNGEIIIKTVVITLDNNIRISELNKKEIWNRISSLLDGAEKTKSDSIVDQGSNGSKSLNLSEVGWAFRPIWNVENKLVASYRCSPFWYSDDGIVYYGVSTALDHESGIDFMSIDIQTLERAIKGVRELIAEGKSSYVTVPVRLSTLGQRSSRSHYLNICRNIPTRNRDRLIFELVDISQQYKHMAHRIVEMLRPYGRNVVCMTEYGCSDLSQFKGKGLSIVGLSIPHKGLSEKVIIEELGRFSDQAKKIGVKTYADGIQSMSLIAAASCNGFTFLVGKEFELDLRNPQEVYPLSLESMYGHMLS